MHCKKSKEGCDWVGTIGDYQQQHAEVCTYTDVPCPFEGCDVAFRRKDWETHAVICNYRIVGCQWCSCNFKEIELELHYSECDSYPVECANEGCKQTFKRREDELMGKHVAVECRFQEIPCEFESAGCTKRLLRFEQANHNEAHVQHHLSLIVKDNAKMKNKVDIAEKKQIKMEEIITKQNKKLVAVAKENERLSQIIKQTQPPSVPNHMEKATTTKAPTAKVPTEEKAKVWGENAAVSINTAVAIPPTPAKHSSPGGATAITGVKESKKKDQLMFGISVSLLLSAKSDEFCIHAPDVWYIAINLEDEAVQSDLTIRFCATSNDFDYACTNWGCKVYGKHFAFQSGPYYSKLCLFKAGFHKKSPIVYVVSENNKMVKPESSKEDFMEHHYDLNLEDFVYKEGNENWLFLVIKLHNAK